MAGSIALQLSLDNASSCLDSNEMLLGGGTLLERRIAPFLDEGFGGHFWGHRLTVIRHTPARPPFGTVLGAVGKGILKERA